jgi:hypothetical protein
MMKRPGAITEKLLGENSMVAMDVFFCKTLLGNAAILCRLLHHK